MKLNTKLIKYAEQTLMCLDRLYTVRDTLSEAITLLNFNNNQTRLRKNGYDEVAYNFLLELGVYHEWRMNNPIDKKYDNIRCGNHLGLEILIAEDKNKSSKIVTLKPYWIEGNTIHKKCDHNE
jgi:hypothetical protein